jgi:glycosyltransferase involved in cell wall biosynthesis
MRHRSDGQSEDATVKSVLMIAYFYPPMLSVGRYRTMRFERHLRSFGYEPLIHTVKNPDTVREKTAAGAVADGANVYRSWALNLGWVAGVISWFADKIARIFGLDLKHDPFRRLLFFPDVHIGWIPRCVGTSLSIVRRHRVSAIYVTCSPFSAAISGLILKKLTGLPLVLDFRDPWSFNDHNSEIAYLPWLIRFTERRVIASCDSLIANTATAAKTYRALYPEYQGKIAQIYNGVTGPPPVAPIPAPCFTLLCVGTFYNTEYLDLLFETVNALFGSREIRIEFAGFDLPALNRAIERHRIGDRVVRHGFIDEPKELQRIYSKTSALLYTNGFNKSGKLITSVVRAKLYDYLATGIPILAVAPPGEASELLARYSPDSVVVSGDLHSSELRSDFARGLAIMYERWQRGDLRLQPNGEFRRMFGGEELTRQLSVILDRLTNGTSHASVAGHHAGVGTSSL